MAAVAARELGVDLGVSSLEALSVGYGAAVRVRARRSRRPVLLASVEEMHDFRQALNLWSTRVQMSTHQRLCGYPLQLFHQRININYSDYFIDPCSLRFSLGTS